MRYELKDLAESAAARMADEVSVGTVRAAVTALKVHSGSSAVAAKAFADVLRKMREAPTDELLRAAF